MKQVLERLASAVTLLLAVGACASRPAYPAASTVAPASGVVTDDPDGVLAERRAKARDCGGPAAVGRPAPPLALGSVRVRKGHPAVVVLFGTWCEPCKRAMPIYEAIHQRYREAGLDVLGVSVDVASSPEERETLAAEAESFARNHHASFAVASDGAGQVDRCWMRPALRCNVYFVDRQGIVRALRTGFAETPNDAAEIDALAKGLLAR